MKTDKEFIKGIYEKYDEYTKEKQENKQKILKKIINVAAVIIVLISSVIVFSESEPKQVLIDNKKVENDQSFNSNLKTVGNFENFYEIIKEKYASTQTSIFNGETVNKKSFCFSLIILYKLLSSANLINLCVYGGCSFFDFT